MFFFKNFLNHLEGVSGNIDAPSAEVKYGSQILYQFRKKDDLSMKFKDYKSIDFAYKLISDKYKRFYTAGDFASYKEFKKAIKNSSMRKTTKENIIEQYKEYNKIVGQELVELKKLNRKITPYYKSQITSFGINPILIPTKFNISNLECPIKLLEKKRKKLSFLNLRD